MKVSLSVLWATVILTSSISRTLAEEAGQKDGEVKEPVYPEGVSAMMERMAKLPASKTYSLEAVLKILGINDPTVDEGGFGEAGGIRGYGKSFRIHYRYRVVVRMSGKFGDLAPGDVRWRVSTIQIGFIENPMEAMRDQTEKWITPYWASSNGITNDPQ